MSNSKWVTMKGPLRKALEHCVAQWHPHLAGYDNQILIFQLDNVPKRQGRELAGRAKMANEELKAMAKQASIDPPIWVIEIPAEVWQDAKNEKHPDELSHKQLAIMDNALCYCRTEEKDDGSIRHFIEGPDIYMFSSNLQRFGAWLDLSTDEDDGDAKETALEYFFKSAEQRQKEEAEAAEKAKADKVAQAAEDKEFDDDDIDINFTDEI